MDAGTPNVEAVRPAATYAAGGAGGSTLGGSCDAGCGTGRDASGLGTRITSMSNIEVVRVRGSSDGTGGASGSASWAAGRDAASGMSGDNLGAGSASGSKSGMALESGLAVPLKSRAVDDAAIDPCAGLRGRRANGS